MKEMDRLYDSSSISDSSHYSFQSLAQDIMGRCTSLNFLKKCNIKIRYLDDKHNSWINLPNNNKRGFKNFGRPQELLQKGNF